MTVPSRDPEGQICDVEGCTERANSSGPGIKSCRPHYDELWLLKTAAEGNATIAAGGPWPQTCPRRYEMFQRGGAEGQDLWRMRGDGQRMERTCSYCGSLHPDDFMAKLDEHWQLGPTDKNYKVYLAPPETGSVSGHTKFYFPHLSDEQRQEFLDRLIAGALNIGYPGHFYVLPFFIRTRGPGS